MSTLRTMVVVAVLVAVGYMVYATLHMQPPAEPPDGAPDDWAGAPIVEMPGDLAAAPSFDSGEPYAGPTTPSYPSREQAPVATQPQSAAPGVAASPWVEDPQMSGGDHNHHDHQHGLAPLGVPQGSSDPAASGFNPAALNAVSPPLTDAAASAYAPAPSTQPFPVPQDVSPSAQIPADRYSNHLGAAGADRSANVTSAEFNSAAHAQPAEGREATSANSLGTPAGEPNRAAPSQLTAAVQRTQAMLAQGQLAEAHLGLSRWYDVRDLSESDRAQMLDLLDQLAGTVVYSQMHLLEGAYEVQPGDTLQSIGKVYNVPWQLLAKINGISDPSRLHASQLLKVIRGPFGATLDLEQHLLTLWLGERYAGRFRIGVGRDHSTPEGEFYVQAKVVNPTYYGPDGVVDRDDPSNPLGEHWIDLGNQLGLHGTIDPSSIGRDVSRGCVRLHPRDIEDVYDILSVGSKVIIRR